MPRKQKRKTRKNSKRRRQRGGKIAIDEYTSILGSGGFGLILSEPTGARVVKLYYDPGACADMNLEYAMLSRVYEAFQQSPIPQVIVPKPIQVDNTPFQFREREVLCGIEMTRLKPIPLMREAKNPMVHIILKEDYEKSGMINKELGRKYGEDISNENPSRGFFAGPQYIKNVLLPSLTDAQKGVLDSVEAIAETLGKIFAVILGVAGVVPNDVEYCLVMHDEKLHVAVLDFGMAFEFDAEKTPANIAHIILKGNSTKIRAPGVENDLYFPYRSDTLFPYFERGMNSVLTSLGEEPSTKRNILKTLIEQYNTD